MKASAAIANMITHKPVEGFVTVGEALAKVLPGILTKAAARQLAEGRRDRA